MKRFIIDKLLKAQYIWSGIKTLNQLHLMDDVIYNNEKYFVNNMVSCCGQCGTVIHGDLCFFEQNGTIYCTDIQTDETVAVGGKLIARQTGLDT